MSTLRVFERRPRTIFDEFFSDFSAPLNPVCSGRSVAADVTETADSFQVALEAPGFTRDELEIDFKKGQLSVSGNRATQSEDKGQSFHIRERSSSGFRRSFSFPDIQESRIEANFDNGILHISLPKSEEVRPKKISIGHGKKESD